MQDVAFVDGRPDERWRVDADLRDLLPEPGQRRLRRHSHAGPGATETATGRTLRTGYSSASNEVRVITMTHGSLQ